ncbi:hypothetical protein M9458_058239, partial [Cirrhinus mrigala]
MQPQIFPSENAKVTFLISLLTGKALQWAKAIWNSENPIIHAYEQFTNHFSEVLSTTTNTLSISDQLFRLQQGTSSVNEYTLHFRTLAAASGLNETALLGAYRQGLNPDICAAMALYDDSIGLESFLQRTMRVSQHSGSSGNFISRDCLNQLQLSRCRHSQVLAVKTIQGKPLGCGRIRHSSPFITLQVGMFHSEMRLLVLEDSTFSIILGHPWLQQHRPELSWGPCDVIHWSEHCLTNCLVNVPRSPPVPVYLSSTRVESPEPSFTPEIPAEYMAFQDVFSKRATTHLPPHRPWDCAIELLSGAQLPKGRVYPLSIPEHQAMEKYIAEASSSWARRMEVYVHASIYCQLNSQIKQPYPLPL